MMRAVRFRNGDIMPIFGLGTFLASSKEVSAAVITALESGYRMIDCAPIYGNEGAIGKALQEMFNRKTVTREEVFITSKLWNSNHRPEDVEPALKNTLEELKVDYLDLYLIHWPVAFKHEVRFPEKAEDFISLEECPVEETWKALEQLKAQGLCRHIGVSNFNIPKLDRLFQQSEVKPEMNQVEMHPYFQQPELVEYCKAHDILLTAYSPLGSQKMKKSGHDILAEPLILELAKQHQATPAQILLAWEMGRGIVVIPKSVRPERIRENIGALEIHLSPVEMREIAKLDRQMRMTDGSGWTFPESPYTQEKLWKE